MTSTVWGGGRAAAVGRDAVAPPELARDTPVLNVAQPVEPNRLEVGRCDAQPTRLDGLDGARRHRTHPDEPLWPQQWLHHVARAAA